MSSTNRVTPDSYYYHYRNTVYQTRRSEYLKQRIRHSSAALEKVQKFKIQNYFRHRGKETGLIVRASQQRSQTSHHIAVQQTKCPLAIRRKTTGKQTNVFRVQVTKDGRSFLVGIFKTAETQLQNTTFTANARSNDDNSKAS